MKASKLSVALVLSLGIVGVTSASDKLKIVTQYSNSLDRVAVVAECSVAYDTMTQQMTKNPELRREFSKQSDVLKELITLSMADLKRQRFSNYIVDEYDVAKDKLVDTLITNEELRPIVTKCVQVMANLGK
jgi:hypothetical protein